MGLFQVIAFVVALSVGIGIGFAIGNDKVSEAEPIIGKYNTISMHL